jgi:hypothetical protein
VKTFSTDQLRELMTVTQLVTDLCLNEIEDCGELSRERPSPMCEYILKTILTRGSEPHQADKFATIVHDSFRAGEPAFNSAVSNESA